MRFLWPSLFFLLALIPLVLLGYIWALRRRQRYTVRYSSLAIVRPAVPKYSRLRRHLPFALFLAGLAVLIVGLARPAAEVVIPSDQTTVILAIDVSGSMRSADITPTRIGAAEAAALDFIHRQKPGMHVGIVAFSGNAELIQPPTTDTEALTAAIHSLMLGRATAIGSGILKSIDAISEIDQLVPRSVADPSSQSTPVPVVPGTFAPDIIVVLTDGVSNAGIAPLDAAQEAADRGLRVYTIGFGTQNGSIPVGPGGGGQGRQNDPFGSGGGGGFGGGAYGGGGYGGGGFGGGGGRFRTGIDETTLKKIAQMTGGQYYTATSAEELQKVFQGLPTNIIARHEVMEVTVGFTAAGAFLTLLALALSIRWNPLP